MSSYTTDSFFNGRIRIKQRRDGYRFSIDAVLLAHLADARAGDRVIDLGTGCGVISLLLAYRRPDITLFAVEIQEELVQLANGNVEANFLQSHITVLDADLKTINPVKTAGLVDLVVCNPPFRRAGSGRVNPDYQRAVARHELKADLKDVVGCAQRMLKAGGRFVTIYAAERTADVICQMRCEGIEPKRLHGIHSTLYSHAKLVVIEGKKGGNPGLTLAAPLIIYNEDGSYTDAVQQMFAP